MSCKVNLMSKTSKSEAIFWSIAFPGFGQLLNGQVLKGLLFILLEFIINLNSSFNLGIMFSFLGKISLAANVVNHQWLMFYPCVYMYAMYDAFKFADGETRPFSYMPFAFGAYFVTTGLMYSPHTYFGISFGPIWLPMMSLVPGLIVGFIIQYLLTKYNSSSISDNLLD
jgi:TM2 domain-containing membrane protein YozV